MIEYLYYLLGYNKINEIEPKKCSITSTELKNIKLKKHNVEKSPAFARYLQPDNFNILSLSKKQLNDILNTKLKPVIPNKKITYWEPEHPVLNELLKKTTRI